MNDQRKAVEGYKWRRVPYDKLNSDRLSQRKKPWAWSRHTAGISLITTLTYLSFRVAYAEPLSGFSRLVSLIILIAEFGYARTTSDQPTH